MAFWLKAKKVVGKKPGLKCREKWGLRETSEQAEMVAGWSSSSWTMMVMMTTWTVMVIMVTMMMVLMLRMNDL